MAMHHMPVRDFEPVEEWEPLHRPSQWLTPTSPPEFARKLLSEAKQLTLKSILQGRPMRHPLHPMLSHLPAGLWPAALVFDSIAMAHGGHDPSATLCAWWCILVGLAGALLAIAPGIADWWDIPRASPAWSFGLIHASLNVIVFGLFLVTFILRCLAGPARAPLAPINLILTAVGTGILLISIYLGGRLVFEHGVSVGRE